MEKQVQFGHMTVLLTTSTKEEDCTPSWFRIADTVISVSQDPSNGNIASKILKPKE